MICTLCFQKFETTGDLIGHECLGKLLKRSDAAALMMGATSCAVLTVTRALRLLADKSVGEGLGMSPPQLLRAVAEEMEIDLEKMTGQKVPPP